MKNQTIKIILLASLSLTWGCSKNSVPFSPTVQTLQPAAPQATTPVFSSAWSGNLSSPSGIACDGSQFVYVTDADLNQVLKYDLNGNLQAQWGNSGAVALDQPSGIALKDGNVYVADSANSRIVEYDSMGNVLATLRPTEGEYYLFIYPTGISFDTAGNLYVSDNSDMVYRFDSGLALTGQWNAQGSLDFPIASAEDTLGNVYVANYNSNSVVKINSQSGSSSSWGQTGSQAGQFNGPSDIKLDSNGNVMVVDTDNHRVQVFNQAGVFQSQWGPNADDAKSLSYPSALALSSNGFIFVVDSGNSRIVKYSVN